MAYPPDPVEINVLNRCDVCMHLSPLHSKECPNYTRRRDLPRYRSHSERWRTIAAVLNCIAAFVNMAAVLFLMFAYYHVL